MLEVTLLHDILDVHCCCLHWGCRRLKLFDHLVVLGEILLRCLKNLLMLLGCENDILSIT